MAVFQTYQASAGNREDLIPVITMISPHDTPLTSSIGTKKATGMTHDWLTDSLDAPAANAVVEGADATFGTLTPRVRNSNYIQNIRKEGMISDNQQAVLKAGVQDEYAYQLEKKTKELALDIERAFTQGPRSQGNTSTAAFMGGFFYYLTTNLTNMVAPYNGAGNVVSATASGVVLHSGDGAASSAAANDYIYIKGGTGAGQYRQISAVSTDTLTLTAAWDVQPDTTSTYAIYHTPVALTETVLNDAFEACFNQGGNPNVVLAPTKQKRNISGFASTIRRLSGDATALTNSIDIYESDFGTHAVKTDRWMPAGAVGVIDTTNFDAAYLRPVKAEELARTGSARKFMIEAAVTLEARAENSSALIFGLA